MFIVQMVQIDISHCQLPCAQGQTEPSQIILLTLSTKRCRCYFYALIAFFFYSRLFLSALHLVQTNNNNERFWAQDNSAGKCALQAPGISAQTSSMVLSRSHTYKLFSYGFIEYVKTIQMHYLKQYISEKKKCNFPVG